MKQIKEFIKNNAVSTFALIALFIFFAGTLGQFYHVDLAGDIVGKNTVKKLYPILFGNKDGTTFFRVDSAGNTYVKGTLTQVGAAAFTVAPVFTVYPTFSTVTSGIDSFTTTAATDTVALSGSVGFTTSSPCFVRQMNPSWSIDVDTAIYVAHVVITGAGNTRLAVTRVKSYTGNGATAVKSGAQYFYEVRK
jgi:hypothetical protein